MNYSERIYELRKNADISQEALASAIGSTRQQVSRWECGSSLPSMKYLEAMASYFNTDVNDIMCTDIHKDDSVKEETHLDAFRFRMSVLFVIHAVVYFIYVALFEVSDMILFAASRAHETGDDYDFLDITYYKHYVRNMLSVTFVIISLILMICGIMLLVSYFKKNKNKVLRYDAYRIAMMFFIASLAFPSAYMYKVLRFAGSVLYEEVLEEIFYFFGFFLLYRSFDVFITIILSKTLKDKFMVSECGKGLFKARIVYLVLMLLTISLYIHVLIINRNTEYYFSADYFLNILFMPMSLIVNVVFEILFHNLKKKEVKENE